MKGDLSFGIYDFKGGQLDVEFDDRSALLKRQLECDQRVLGKVTVTSL
jgi:hypothetical protein